MSRSAKKVISISSALFALLLTLTGCAKMDAAAVIGDQEISLETVQNSVESIITERGLVDTQGLNLPTEDYLTRSQAQFHISILLLENVADEFGIEISKSEIDLEYQRILSQLGGEEELPRALVGAAIAKDDLRSYIKGSLIYQKLGQALVSQGIAEEEIESAQQALLVRKAKELGVVINPRYGVWDESTATIQPGGDSNGSVEDKSTPPQE